MTAPVQKGTAMNIGCGGYTYTGWVVEEAGLEPTAEIEVIKDEDNATQTKILSDPGVRVTISCIGEGSSTLEAVKKGDAITVNSVSMMVEEARQTRTRGVIKATLTLVKEASMTYT